MKRLNIFSISVLVLAVLFAACEGQEDALIEDRLEDNPLPNNEFVYDYGDANFTNFISIGNSLTAGYMDGALYNGGQQNSFASLMAEAVGIADENFTVPDINSETGFNTTVENPQNGMVLGRYKLDTSIPGPSPVLGGDPISGYSGPASGLNNFGVPGIVLGQLLTPATGGPNDPSNPAFNPFYQRFASNPSQDGMNGSTILQDALSAQPTFFTLWIGSNDVLGYAVSGGANEAILTSDSDFNTQYNGLISTLMGNTQANGVVANIPFFLGVPYFQAVTWNAITLDAATAEAVSQGLGSVNQAIMGCVQAGLISQADAEQRLMSYSAGNNPILAIDEELTDLETCFDALLATTQIDAQTRAQLVPYEQSRPLTQGELVVLSAGSVLGTEADGDPSTADTPIGVVIPLGFSMADGSLSGDQYYLTLAEQQQIETSRATFNGIIAAAVSANPDRLALYDTGGAGSAFLDIFGLSDGVPGIRVSGVNLQPDFSPNGVFSTDGIHPNRRGNAIIANQFIEVIENNFGASLPRVDVLAQPSVQTCNGNCVSQQ